MFSFPGEARISGPEPQCDKSKVLFFFFFLLFFTTTEMKGQTRLELHWFLSSSLLLLFLPFSFFFSFEHWARSLQEPYNIKTLRGFISQ